jgi:hypothetical protein
MLIGRGGNRQWAWFVVRGRVSRVARCGVAGTVIDYSLSRVARAGAPLFNDLATDDALFHAVGDYQFEVYRLMRDKLGSVSLKLSIAPFVHTYIPLALYPRRGSRGISDIPLRPPRFTKII